MSDILKSKTEIGNYIKMMREYVGFNTSKELADKMCISAAIVSNWENGIKTPSYTNYVMLAGIFGVSINDIFATKNPYDRYNELKELNNFDSDEYFFINKLGLKKQKKYILDYLYYKDEISKLKMRLIDGDDDAFDDLFDKYFEPMLFYGKKNEYCKMLLCCPLDKKFNYDDLNNYYSMNKYLVININKNKKKFINNEVFKRSNPIILKDNRDNEIMVKEVSLSMYDYINTEVLDGSGLPNESLEWLVNCVNDEDKIRILKLMFNNFSDYEVNTISELILFEYYNNDLIESFIDQLTDLEKSCILQSYLKMCKDKDIMPRVEVLYKFLIKNTKILKYSNGVDSEYDIEKTLYFSLIVMKYLNSNKEFITLNSISEIIS